MAITARTAEECFDRFRGHVGALVSEMLPTDCPMLCIRPPRSGKQDRRTLCFSNPSCLDAVPLETRAHGKIFLYIAQELRTFPDNGQQRLRTVAYWYKVFSESPLVNDDAVIRWEYASATPRNIGPCRHHVQFGKMVPSVPFGSSAFDLTRLHMPTGWVTMEEVFRFLVHDLGVAPPCGARWPDVLEKSERAFYQGFTDKGATGHSA